MKKRSIKKIIKLILLIIIIIILINFICFIFKKHHQVEYNISSDGNTYNINETYKDNEYYILIDIDDYKFSFDIKNTFNKKKKIIKEIKYYENDNYKCLYLPNTNTNIICSDKNYNYSYDLSKNFASDFIDELKKAGYSNDTWNSKESKEERIGSASVYIDNIKENTFIYLYKYNGLYSITNSKLEQLNLFENDNYVNSLASLVDKYYIIANYDDKYTYNSFKIVDITTNKVKEISLKMGISKQSSILGVVENKLYIFDPDNIVEYEIDPKKEQINAIADKDTTGKLYNGTWTDINIYDFKTKKITFSNNYDLEENAKFISKNKENYYYIVDENVYKYNDATKIKTMLTSLTDITDMIEVNNSLYILKSNSIYMLKDDLLTKIITYDELRFNNTNRFAVYEK